MNLVPQAPFTLRTKVSAVEQKEHEIFILKCKIVECKNQINFFEEILNNPKADIEIQRRMLLNIEGEELKIFKINEQLNKLK